METADIKEKIQEEILKTEKLSVSTEKWPGLLRQTLLSEEFREWMPLNNSVATAALRQAEIKLKNLKRVLSSVGTKDFGICLKCHKPILVGRILIRPESLLCVNCASWNHWYYSGKNWLNTENVFTLK